MEKRINIELLIKLIRARGGIYNPQHKDYFKRNSVDQLWKEIAQEMNVTVNVVKAKWIRLRNSYARVCRQGNTSSLGGKRKTWYLEDKMSFLKNYMRKRKFWSDSSGRCNERQDSISSNNPDDEEPDDSMRTKVSRHLTSAIELPSFEEMPISTMKPSDNIQILNQSSRPSAADELFFQSILNECQTLSEPKRRKFKLAVQSLLNDFIEEEETKESSSKNPIIVQAYTKCEDYT